MSTENIIREYPTFEELELSSLEDEKIIYDLEERNARFSSMKRVSWF